MLPPIRILSTLSTKFLIKGILSTTLLPPNIKDFSPFISLKYLNILILFQQ